jgi:hypothetical protein
MRGQLKTACSQFKANEEKMPLTNQHITEVKSEYSGCQNLTLHNINCINDDKDYIAQRQGSNRKDNEDIRELVGRQFHVNSDSRWSTTKNIRMQQRLFLLIS